MGVTYGEYLRSKNIGVVGNRAANPITKRDRELAAYAAARKLGIQPENTGARAVEFATRASNELGVAYNANTG